MFPERLSFHNTNIEESGILWYCMMVFIVFHNYFPYIQKDPSDNVIKK